MMLQTCTRCRTRRIKCDSLLPACANCAKSDLECTFHDDAVQQDVPRSYIRSLHDRIQDLGRQVALHQYRAERSPDAATASTAKANPIDQLNYFSVPASSHLKYLERSPTAIITMLAFEALSNSSGPLEPPVSLDSDPIRPDLGKLDRSILAPGLVRHLLNRYGRIFRSFGDIVDSELLRQDGLDIMKLSDRPRFKTLLACAIAAAHQAYKAPAWRPVAQLCREWACEAITPVLSAGDGDSLTAILLLLLYELVDPTRGQIWALLDLAVRTTLQLGWHLADRPRASARPSPGKGVAREGQHQQVRHMSLLRALEGYLRTIFHRPNMLSNLESPATSDDEHLFELHEEIYSTVYSPSGLYNLSACPYVDRSDELMRLLRQFRRQDSPLISQAWLLFAPLCVNHRQCVLCFQDPDDVSDRGMRTLRQQLVTAACQLISDTHRMMISEDDFVSPLIVSSWAMMGGCTLVMAIAKQWTTADRHIKTLIQCTQVLTFFMPHWQGGAGYFQVWMRLTNLLDSHQQSKVVVDANV